MKYYRYTAAAVSLAISVGAAGTSFAAVENLGGRQPVNTLEVSGETNIIEYSDNGEVWTQVPYIREGDICYFDTVHARLFRLSSGSVANAGFYTDRTGLNEAVTAKYKELDGELFAAGLDSLRLELEEEMNNYLAYAADKMKSRYELLCRGQELESYMDDLKTRAFDFNEQLERARASVASSISESYAYTASADSNAAALGKSMLSPASASDSMWANISMTKGDGTVLNSAALTSVYKNIYAMAMVYQCEKSAYYHSADMLSYIKTALENADKYYYNTDTVMYGNWWDFLIGVPARYCKVLSIVWDELSVQERERYSRTLQKFCDYDAYSGADKKPNEQQAGANLVNIANYDYIMGVLTADKTKIENAVEKFYSVFDYKQELLGLNLNGSYSDGFYEDGSFLQHGVPYNGSYGREFFAGVIDMAESLDNTMWGFSKERYERINEWIDRGFIPFIFRSSVMDIVNGRGASRNNADKKYGYQIARSILHYSGLLRDEAKKRAYIETVKYWFLNSTEENGISWQTGCDDFSKSLINSSEYAAKDHTELGKAYVYPNMDRAVYRPSENWAAALAMYSSRIPSYELTNGENTKGWYTGSGALYLYNSNDAHFAKDYWLAADMYCIPGTTVDSTVRYYDADDSKGHYQNGDGEGKSNCDFVGSMALGGGAAAAMQLNEGALPVYTGMTVSKLSANKSYFMLPEGVLCMGTAIEGGNGAMYTCVENRAIDENDFCLYVNGQKSQNTGESAANPETVSILGSCGNISYYFPKGGALVLNRSKRSVPASEVNVNNTNTAEGTFFTMKLNHVTDVNESDASSYCYMLLPEKTAEQAEEFAQNPSFEILGMSDDIHAVSYKEGEKTVTAAVFYAPGTVTAADGTQISCDTQAIVMLDSNGEISVCDATRKLAEINVTVGEETISFDTSGAYGRAVTGVLN